MGDDGTEDTSNVATDKGNLKQTSQHQHKGSRVCEKKGGKLCVCVLCRGVVLQSARVFHIRI